MKKNLLALVAMLCMGAAYAVPQDHTCQGGHNCNTGSGATATAAAGAVAGAAAGAAVVGSGNSSATGGNSQATGGTAIQGQQQGQGQAILGSGNSTVRVSTAGTVGNVAGGSAAGGAGGGGGTGGNAAGGNATGGNAAGGNATGGAANIADGAVRNTVSTGTQSQSVSTAGTVGNVAGGAASIAEGANQNSLTNGSATSGNAQNITLNTFDPNAPATTRALGETEIAVAQINAAAAKEIAAIQAEAQKDSARQKIYNTPSVNGPPLVSSNDTCMGSASGSVNVPGFGVGIGKTYKDDNCVMLKNSRELWNMGMKAAALALMCNDSANREALEVTGYECPQTTKARNGNMALQRAVVPEQIQYTDPIVRARLGLPALAGN